MPPARHPPIGVDASGGARRSRAAAAAAAAALLFALVFGPGLMAWAVADAQYWSNYQLSDAVRRTWESDGASIAEARSRYGKPYRGSLADQYLKHAHETRSASEIGDRAAFYPYPDNATGTRPSLSFDVDLLEHLVERLVKPSNTTLVVHLRIGDTLLIPPGTVDALWAAQKSDWYIRPRGFYECIAPQLPNATLTHVVFVASNVHINVAQLWQGADIERRSEWYKALVDGWFAHRLPHARRVWRSEHFAPDHDFAYMAAARHLVPGGGGYAAAAATLAERAGGRVYACRV